MSDHDPECLLSDPSHFVTVDAAGEPFGCTCALIARVVQREREKAAQRIEELRLNPKNHCIEEYNAGLTNAASAVRGGKR